MVSRGQGNIRLNSPWDHEYRRHAGKASSLSIEHDRLKAVITDIGSEVKSQRIQVSAQESRCDIGALRPADSWHLRWADDRLEVCTLTSIGVLINDRVYVLRVEG